VFDDFWGESWLASRQEIAAGFWPQVDITETDKEIKVSVEIPGAEPKDIDVSVEDSMLTIKGEKKYEREETEKDSIAWSAAMAHSRVPSNCLRK
jgi:HSP20 family protein